MGHKWYQNLKCIDIVYWFGRIVCQSTFVPYFILDCVKILHLYSAFIHYAPLLLTTHILTYLRKHFYYIFKRFNWKCYNKQNMSLISFFKFQENTSCYLCYCMLYHMLTLRKIIVDLCTRREEKVNVFSGNICVVVNQRKGSYLLISKSYIFHHNSIVSKREKISR